MGKSNDLNGRRIMIVGSCSMLGRSKVRGFSSWIGYGDDDNDDGKGMVELGRIFFALPLCCCCCCCCCFVVSQTGGDK